MCEVMGRALCYVALIIMGMVLRKVGFFKESDFHVLSKIVVKITLTAAIIKSFAGRELESSMMILVLMGLGFGVLVFSLGVLTNQTRGKKQQAFAALNQSGCNIGNFVLPFSQSFMDPLCVMAVSLFDVGNAFVSLGGAHSFAVMMCDGSKGISLRPMMKAMVRSVPLMSYMVMILLSLLHISLPGVALEFVDIIAGANSFLAMLMIGIGFSLDINMEQIRAAAGILISRFAAGIGCAVLTWLFLPLPLTYRQGLVMSFLSPITTAAPAFTAQMDGDYNLASTINSLSILISIGLILLSLNFIM